MKTQLYDYDVFPKVVRANTPVTITIRPLGVHVAFNAPTELRVQPWQERTYPLDPTPKGDASYTITPDADGCLRLTHTFATEQAYYLLIGNAEGKPATKLTVYAVDEDLAGLYPLMGDLHLHTNRSDGREDPAIVAAHLRQQGYDYISITDHYNFFGALEAIDAYKDAPIEMLLMTGEEVHLPDCPPHCVHIGGKYSVNALVDKTHEYVEKHSPGAKERFPFAWTKDGGAGFPGVMTNEEFHQTIEEYAKTLEPIPDGIPRFTYAGYTWICEQIRAADGLAIFPHPYWLEGTRNHVDERLTQYLFDKQPFDAFEVLGGESYYEQNGLQTVHYYEARANGLKCPIVGSSDSHSSVNNRNAFICETICFAKANDTPSILEAIRAGHSVALDTISTEYRLVGDYRLVKYACFLMEEYFPLHKAACNEQGRAMKEYHCGDREEGLALLKVLDGRIEKLRRKYFAF